ncbi:DNA mismatch repair endonuclease MutL [Saccharicrinis sp. FJH54]|uniref:DNA mismatch repair endonuclease MutL n=1 Tax=Saccharicrinis sp. FJH54 TaxID=3344665 RepID=UPI0035D3F569
MTDIIKLLPDSVANQIAAGEVIQRPASVVKELVENAIDADSTEIKVIIKDAGKTLIQVIDDGKGMSDTDARMSFERHATSKITDATDLFNIHTKGFRGEALASIAAIAHVEMKSRHSGSEIGTYLEIKGSKVEQQEPVSCPQGTNINVKNLFFNVPARRKFLKSASTEFRHILNEFQRIALVAPEVTFKLYHNDEEILDLPSGSMRQRIVGVFGKSLNPKLVALEVETSIVKITGFIGKPEFARKKFGEQFFFANNRYMRHPYFHKAVMDGYGNILQAETIPSYFLYLDVDPASVDVNIHPTKTEIKFENEQAIWPILMAAVREALGKFNVVPSIDFDQEGAIDIPVLHKDTEIKMPVVHTNPDYNPFKTSGGGGTSSGSYERPSMHIPTDWDKLYAGFEGESETEEETDNDFGSAVEPEIKKADRLFDEEVETVQSGQSFFQYKNRYIITSVKSGLMLIDQHRAHSRILFEKYLKNIENHKVISQKLLFPETIEISAEDGIILEEIKDVLACLGFDVERFGKNTFAINGVPYDTGNINAVALLEQLIETASEQGRSVKTDMSEALARICAGTAAIQYGKKLSESEMQDMVDSLFACSMPNYSPDGKPILTILEDSELERHLK